MTQPAILPSAAERRLARELAEMRSAIDTILEGQRATQLENSTLYGNLTARDSDNNVRAVIGVQADGTWATVAQGGPPPDRPATPVVTPSMAGLIVTWNGQLVSGAPADLLGVQVYLSRLGADFPCDATTHKGMLQHAGDLPVAPLDAGVTYWVKFRAASTSVQPDGTPLLGVESFASSGTPGQVVAAAVIAGIIDDLALAAEAVTEAAIAANAVTGTKIAPDSIQSPHIVAKAIQALHVAADAIQAGSIAADVITGRELRALSILAEHLNANIIEAGHLKAGIIDADKLVATLVLATRVVLGDPVGARMELDETGLDQFDESGARTLQFGADPTGGNFLTILDPANSMRSLASIADTGVITAQSFAIAGSFGYQGAELGERFDALPKGVLTWAHRAIGDYTTGAIGIMELEVSGLPQRIYRIMHSSCYIEPASGVVGAQGEMSLHYTLDGSRPTVSSPTLTTTGRSTPDFGGGLMASAGQVITGDAPQRIRVLLTYQSHGGLSSRFTTLNFDNGLLFWIEDVGPAIAEGGVSSTGAGTGAAAAATYSREFGCTWARTWLNGGQAVRYANGELVQGYYNDGVSGDQVAAFGFDDAAIRAALTGATIDKVQLYLYAHHWYWNSGGQVRLRTHNSGETDIYPTVSGVVQSPTMGKPEGRWITLVNSVGDGFKAGTVRGFALDARDVARNLANYGRFDGIGWGSPPRLRLIFRGGGTGGGGSSTSPTIAAPTGLAAVWNTSGPTVSLTWTPTPGTDSTEVHEFLVDPNDTIKAVLPVPTGTRTSGTLTGSSTYLYAVRARKGTEVSVFTDRIRINAAGQTTEASPSEGTSGLAAPTGFTSTMNASRVVTSTWTPASGVDATEVHEFLVDSSNTLKGTVPVPGASRTTGVLAGGREYLYAARSKKGTAVSGFSNQVRILADGTSVAGAAAEAGGGGGGGTTTGLPTTPGEAMWIGTTPGQNHYNIGIGTSGAHTDYSAGQIAGGYTNSWYKLSSDGLWVICDVNIAAGTTSSGTQYPRCEHREMRENGTTNADWDGSSGTHRLKHLSRVPHVPPNKPSVCFTQIHDAKSDLARVQTESAGGGALKIVMRNTPPGSTSETVRTVQASYTVNADLDCAWSVVNGAGTFTLNGTSLSFPAATAGCYFKFGAYAQTNETIDSASEHCEVWVKAGSVETWHTGYATPTKAPWTVPVVVTGGGGTGGAAADTTTAAGRYGWGTPVAGDEFNVAGSLNTTVWGVYDSAGHSGNGLRKPARITCDGTKAIGTGLANGDTFGMEHKFTQRYGRWEARVRSQQDATSNGNDYHPVLILWGQGASWPADGEIDFLENSVPGQLAPEAYWHYPHPSTVPVQQIHFTGPNIDLTQWHNFAIEWTSTGLVGYVDGVEWCRASGGANANRSNIQDMSAARLTIQLDNFDGTSQTPARMEIDWVRVYTLVPQGVTGGGGTGGGTGLGTPGAAPGSYLNVSRWYLTLPIADPSGQDSSGPWDVYNPELATFKHPTYYYIGTDGWVHYVSPVAGVTTSASSGATRTEFREMLSGLTKANWGFNDGKDHVLTCTLTCDATSISGRKEVLVGQVHDTGGTPPIYLCVNQNSMPGTLVLFKNGPAAGTLLTGISATTVFTYRIAVTGSGSSRKCYIYAGLGETVPATPKFTFAISDFAAQTSGNYFKAGAYNKEPIVSAGGSGVGSSHVRHKILTVV